MYLKRKLPLNRPWQGDIYRDVKLIQDVRYTLTKKGRRRYDGNEVTYNYAIILTQECDLDQDYKNRIEGGEDDDKFIPMILMAPAYLAEALRQGTHLEDYEKKMNRINSREWDKVKKKQNKRYHWLIGEKVINVPKLVIDFKHFFTISRDIFYDSIMDSCYLVSLTILHREELSQRFCNYFSRIGIPDNIGETRLLTESLCSSIPSEQIHQE